LVTGFLFVAAVRASGSGSESRAGRTVYDFEIGGAFAFWVEHVWHLLFCQESFELDGKEGFV
jgi:hypothetical protein